MWVECRMFGDTSALMSFNETGLEGCLYSTICESDYFMGTNRVCWINCKCPHGAIATTTLNLAQPISCER